MTEKILFKTEVKLPPSSEVRFTMFEDRTVLMCTEGPHVGTFMHLKMGELVEINEAIGKVLEYANTH